MEAKKITTIQFRCTEEELKQIQSELTLTLRYTQLQYPDQYKTLLEFQSVISDVLYSETESEE